MLEIRVFSFCCDIKNLYNIYFLLIYLLDLFCTLRMTTFFSLLIGSLSLAKYKRQEL